VNLRRGAGPPLVIGHRGAAAVAPENTLAALQIAVAVGADLVEFDIGPDLQLAHSHREAPADAISLDGALEFLRGHRIGVHLDLKLPGYEAEVVEHVRRHDFVGRALVSTAWAASSRSLARIAPEVPCAIGYPRDRYGISRAPWPAGLTRAGAAALRLAMPVRIPFLVGRARATVLSLHQTLCSRTAVAAAHRAGVPVLAWTANDEATVLRLAAAGVDGIVSDDPGMAVKAVATLTAP
jgi:glycerophosphoryl diester phosphodiesterase